ncbi:hypothetical protein DFJ77DRAFT_548775 [Powellomyces hirtus]|nr:hypothetical protein DFJ77DRAFT_548775 [Powellomyces hirtus]
MVLTVPLVDAFGDSPVFRASVQASENSLNNVDTSIKKMCNIAERIVDLTKDYSAKYSALAEEIQALGGCEDDPSFELLGQQLFKFAQVFKDIERSRMIAASQFKDVFIDPLNNFAANEIYPTKKAGKDYQAAQDNYLNAMGKYMAKRPVDKGIEESARDAAEARRHFHMKTVDYGIKLNEVDTKRRFELVENIIALVYTNFSFFHQGYDTLKDIEPSMRDLTAVLQKTRQEHTRNPGLQSVSFLLPAESYDPTSTASEPKSTRTASTIYKAGYLYKKSSSKMRTVWHRRFFEVQNCYLGYFSLEGKDDAKTTIDLRICMVKETPSPERRFCFDLVSPTKTMTLQAQNKEQLEDWISALQAAIAKSISEEGTGQNTSAQKLTFADPSHTTTLLQTQNPSSPASASARGGNADGSLFARVAAVPGNTTCADCDSTVDVQWASCNLGIVLCITCSGIHRGLGRHVSKVKSLSLDRWDQESGQVLLLLGNRLVNEIFEGGLEQAGGVKPKPDDERAKKQKYCVEKYTTRSYLLPATSSSTTIPPPTHHYLPQLLTALAHGRDVNEADLEGRTILHKACEDPVLVEFLLAWGADAEKRDDRGWTPLHSAVDAGAVNSVLAFLRRTARIDVADKEGKLPIDLAGSQSSSSPSHAHIVSLLAASSPATNTYTAPATAAATSPRTAGTSPTGPPVPAKKEPSATLWEAPPADEWDKAERKHSDAGNTKPIDGMALPPLPSATGSDPWAEEQAQWGT